MATLYLIRHGRTDWSENPERIRSWHNIPLNKKGVRDVEHNADRLTTVPLTEIWTDDLARCTKSAAVVNDAQNNDAEIKVTSELRDWHVGAALIGRKADEVQNELRYYTRMHTAIVPGGESYDHFVARILGRTQELLARPDSLRLLLVGHGKVLHLLYHWVSVGMRITSLDYAKLPRLSKEFGNTGCWRIRPKGSTYVFEDLQ